jgi:hypothetical protein
MLSESQITLAVARHLGQLGNTILSIALPGDGSGVIFHASTLDQPSFVPDIVARTPEGIFILLEAKPKYSVKDVHKLSLLSTEVFAEAILNVLGAEQNLIRTALAFGDEILAGKRFSPQGPSPDLVYVVDSGLKCHLVINNCHLLNI